MPTQAQVKSLMQESLRDGQTADQVVTALVQTYGWSPQQAREIFITHAQNIGLPSVQIAGNTIEFSPTDKTVDLPIPGIAAASAVTAAPTVAPEAYSVDPSTLAQIAREEAGLTRGGRENIFRGFMSAQPGFGGLNPLVQRGLARSFNPLSAQFALQAALPDASGKIRQQDFRQFLAGGPQRFTAQDFQSELAPVGAAFNAQAPTVDQNALLDAFEDQAVQDNLMATVAGLGMSPFLRRFIPGAVGRQRTQMFEEDPTANPFVQFLNRLGQ